MMISVPMLTEKDISRVSRKVERAITITIYIQTMFHEIRNTYGHTKMWKQFGPTDIIQENFFLEKILYLLQW